MSRGLKFLFENKERIIVCKTCRERDRPVEDFTFTNESDYIKHTVEKHNVEGDIVEEE